MSSKEKYVEKQPSAAEEVLKQVKLEKSQFERQAAEGKELLGVRQEQIDELDKDIDQLKAKVAELLQAQLQAAASGAVQQAAAVATVSTAAQTDGQAIEAQVAVVAAGPGAAELAELGSLRAQLAEVRGGAAAASAEAERLKAQVQKLKEEAAAVQKQRQQREKQVRQLEAAAAEDKQKVQAAEARAQAAEVDAQARKQELADMQAWLGRAPCKTGLESAPMADASAAAGAAGASAGGAAALEPQKRPQPAADENAAPSKRQKTAAQHAERRRSVRFALEVQEQPAAAAAGTTSRRGARRSAVGIMPDDGPAVPILKSAAVKPASRRPPPGLSQDLVAGNEGGMAGEAEKVGVAAAVELVEEEQVVKDIKEKEDNEDGGVLEDLEEDLEEDDDDPTDYAFQPGRRPPTGRNRRKSTTRALMETFTRFTLVRKEDGGQVQKQCLNCMGYYRKYATLHLCKPTTQTREPTQEQMDKQLEGGQQVEQQAA
ncbi:hypothetical protein HYH02_004393 [Chlamydomonas schloesseri]|uniref:Uncharacterized protein n=1 Tax=Chlamydomonas schloesseri TaxID=2026947 RepID=A0A835WR59_9CHLO|nr:hypothetical protein HYH02_004393 [Chlamydomonas schloesseri]|eukprot:KAG2451125.1 hypothetical protein HYH02_004393 [Chlamydomonas schloesseri]